MTPLTYKEIMALDDKEAIEAVQGKIVKQLERKTGTSHGKRGSRKWSIEALYVDMDGKEDVKIEIWGRKPLGDVEGKIIKAWSTGDDKWTDQLVAKVDDEYGTSVSVPSGAGLNIGGKAAGSSKGDDDEGEEKSSSKKEKDEPVDYEKSMTAIANHYVASADLTSNVILPQLEKLGIKIDSERELIGTIFIEGAKHKLIGHAPSPSKKAAKEREDGGAEEGGEEGPADSDDIPF